MFSNAPVVFLKAPFVIDPFVTRTFDFRMLAQNRRIVDDETRREELDFFHQALTSISEGVPSELVKRFLVDCYVRGARIAAETVDFEGSTAVFTKRRYRDKWNRTVTRRVAKRHNHSVKIKAKVRARGAHGSTRYVRKTFRHLARRPFLLVCRNKVSCNAPMWASALPAVVLGPTGHVLEKKGEDAAPVESPSRRRLACRIRDSAAMRSAAPDED